MFQFFCMSKATELGETVQKLTRWCNVSTKVISGNKLLTRDFINRKKRIPENFRKKFHWSKSAVCNFNSYIQTAMKWHLNWKAKHMNRLTMNINVENNFHWNKLQRSVSAVFHFSFLLKIKSKLYLKIQSCKLKKHR